MASFLRVVAGVCLLTVWLIFAGILIQSASGRLAIEALVAAVLISIPSVILYAFCQVVEDVRDMRDNIREAKWHLEVIRKYYDLGKSASQ
jgi:ABC-type anion transport system duplicated permease subunit